MAAVARSCPFGKLGTSGSPSLFSGVAGAPPSAFTQEKVVRHVSATMKDYCPFLKNLSTRTSSFQLTANESKKFETKCPFGRMLLENQRTTEIASVSAGADFAADFHSRCFHSHAANPEDGVRMQTVVAGAASLLDQASAQDVPLSRLDPSLWDGVTVVPPVRHLRKEKISKSIAPVTKHDVEKQCFEAVLNKMKEEGNYRKFNHIDRKAGLFPKADNRLDIRPSFIGEEEEYIGEVQPDVTVWCNNDYLGMGQKPCVLEAMKNTIDAFGAGSGGTRNISGTTSLHVLLERELADLHHKEAALLFSSCYTANASLIPTLISKMPPGAIIYSDEKNHASLIEGIRHSKAPKFVFRHNDVAHLRELFAESDPNAAKLIIFESVYSMDGTISPIKEICDVADEFHAFTLLDEVHAVGLYGPHGGGVAEERGLCERLDIITGTLGKAYGLYGGFVTAKASVIDIIRSFSPGFIFTTSLPPVIVGGALSSVRYLKEHGEERRIQRENSAYLKEKLRLAKLPVMPSESHIVPLLVGDSKLCRAMSDHLLEQHKVYMQPINYPTVPRGTERFRLTPTPVHTKKEIDHLVEVLLKVWKHFGKPLERVQL